jgi:argininosuccinate lyase
MRQTKEDNIVNEGKVGERLAELPAAEVVTHLYGPRMREERDTSFGYLTAVNQAHVVMLAEQAIITRATAAALLGAIDKLATAGKDELPLDPRREDLYFNYEHAIIELVGPAIGGQMHTARSRNDLGSTMFRMRCRDTLLQLLLEVCRCRESLLAKAADHLTTVMPGYTHLQPAQPITFAHYLLGIEQALQRDTARLFGALQRTQLNPLGAGALAGTGFAINRERTARLLGFAGLAVNTLDAVASRDYLLETAAAGAILGATLSRYAQDLYVFYTNEFGTIDFPDRVAGTSSIMPQKKNPIVLEHIKGRTAQIAGALMSGLAGIRNTNYTNVIDANREALRPVWPALDELLIALRLTQVTTDAATPRADLMLARCKANFSTVTELADTLVRQWGISFREAHEIVGGVVRDAIAAGTDAAGITAAMVLEHAAGIVGSGYAISDVEVQQALDPLHNVEARAHAGGPAPTATATALVGARAQLAADVAARDACVAALQVAQDELAAAVSARLDSR